MKNFLNPFLAPFFILCLFTQAVFSVPPSVKIPPLKFDPGKAERVLLKNGVVVYLMEDHELPLFDMNIRMKTSPADEPVPDAFSFFGGLWRTGGTKKRTPDQLNEELEFIPATVETSGDNESIAASVSCLSKDIPKALEIFADVLFYPQFDETQLSLSKAKAMEGLRRKNETPNQIARRAFRDVVYGKTHVYAYEPSEKSIQNVSRKHLIALHKKVVVPDNAVLAVAGDFQKADMIAKLESLFADWKPVNRVVPSYDFSVKHAASERIFCVDKDSNQSRITMGHVGPARHNPDHFPLVLANYILGDGGPSRLFGEIRSRLGLAYVVVSFVQESAGPGLIGVACQTKSASTVAAIKAIGDELDKFSQGPIKEDEVRLAKDATINSFVFGFDSAWEIVNNRASNEFFGYPMDYPDTYTARIEAVRKQDIGVVAKKYFSKNDMKIMVVGNEKNFDSPLDQLGPVTRIPLDQIN